MICRWILSLADIYKKSFSRFSCHSVILVVYQRVMRDSKVALVSHCRHKAIKVWQECDRKNMLLSRVIDWYSGDVTVWQEKTKKLLFVFFFCTILLMFLHYYTKGNMRMGIFLYYSMQKLQIQMLKNGLFLAFQDKMLIFAKDNQIRELFDVYLDIPRQNLISILCS